MFVLNFIFSDSLFRKSFIYKPTYDKSTLFFPCLLKLFSLHSCAEQEDRSPNPTSSIIMSDDMLIGSLVPIVTILIKTPK